MIFLRCRRIASMEFWALALVLWSCSCSKILVSTSFVLGGVGNIRVHSPSPSTTTTTTTTTTTRCWGKYSRNTPKKIRIDKDDVLSYERSLVQKGQYSHILGSDETGLGSIAGPVITASVCILSLGDKLEDPSTLPTTKLLPLVKDSKQLSPEERNLIYQIVMDHPEVYKVSIAQRSNTEIDATGNILKTTQEALQESIEDLAQGLGSNNIYGIVDGKKAPKVSITCRPMVKADQQVYTVALASIVAKVTLDRMFLEWHQEYPQYGLDQNLGYATKEHIEAIHQHGPCPLHRMTFKSLKGR